jgi:hypothetical protein
MMDSGLPRVPKVAPGAGLPPPLSSWAATEAKLRSMVAELEISMKNRVRSIHIHVQNTAEHVERVNCILANHSAYDAAKQIAADFLGAKKTGANQASFGFWVPGLVDGDLQGKAGQIKLELFTPLDKVDYRGLKKGQPVSTCFQRDEVQLAAVGDYMVGVIAGVQIGTRTEAGTFYWLRYSEGEQHYIMRDPMVASAPFGVYAPAELFDTAGMLANRRDMDYFRSWYRTIYPDGTYRAKDIGVHLEIHTETATDEGTFEALTARYRAIGEKIQANIDAGMANIYRGLTPADLNFVAFDSIELTPEVPPAEREAVKLESGEFFQITDQEDRTVTVQLKRPDISNWGYDTPVLGSAAINPSILGSLRPNEFLEFVETIHTLPGRPIQLCIDSVLGHCDFQGAFLLETFDQISDDGVNPKYIHSKYLRGPNMYGRDIDFSEPNVKAILLELLIRKVNYGFDCVRVDGAQDFIIEMDTETGLRIQDDEFLNEMSNITQNINGLVRRLDMNLEDGRPWPDDLNWIYNAKYLDHTIERTLPFGDRVKQWSPIIFAHNVHAKFKWFMNKWDRFVEVYRYGENWITGHSNHDNARYFYRMTMMQPSSLYRSGDSFDDFYNDQLGDTMKAAAHNAMDNNALTALSLGFLPGNPMFLLNALFHTPWLFMRDIDETYDVKIVGDEGSRFFSWYVDPELYSRPDKFIRLKAMGFTTYRQLVAPPDEKDSDPGFLDALFALCQQIKTDALMARHLFDEPGDAGGFAHVDDLRPHYEKIARPQSVDEARYLAMLLSRIQRDPTESTRRVDAARKLLAKNQRFLKRDRLAAHPDLIEGIIAQIQKLEFLAQISDSDLALLIEDADYQTEYNVTTWAAEPILNALTPEPMRTGGDLTATDLKSFAKAFMHDARDAARVHQYEDSLDSAQAQFNFTLRCFRQEHSWLLRNPTNDVKRDYFSRKLFINGAKDVGDWGDTGDIVKCNTIYYGWRTSPDEKEQIFLIANMEGKPIERCPLDLFLNLKGEWEVVAASPSMGEMPQRIGHDYVITDFKNGQALLLMRAALSRKLANGPEDH